MKMKRKILAFALAVLTVFSVIPFTVLADGEATPYVYMNTEPQYVNVTANDHTTLFEQKYTCATEGGTPGITFWLNVKNLTSPVYLYGAMMQYSTVNPTSGGVKDFDSQHTGGGNLQNSGFRIDVDGDYFLYVPISYQALAWNCTKEAGNFESIKNLKIKACDAEAFDTSGLKLDSSFEIALMGIIEGKVDLTVSSAEYKDADGTSLGSGAAVATLIPNTTVPNNGGTQSAVWEFSRVSAPESVTPAVPTGKYLYAWADDDGNISLPMLSDSLNAVYLDKQIFVSYAVEAADMPMNSKGNKVKLKLTDTSLGVTNGTVKMQVSTDMLYSAEFEDGYIRIDYDTVAEDGTVAEVIFDTLPDVAGTMSVELTGDAMVGDKEAVVLLTAGTLKVVGQQAGAYFKGAEYVRLNKTDGETRPAGQTLWQGSVYTNGSDGVTFVYELTGVESEIIADNFNVGYNDTLNGWSSWNWQNGDNLQGFITCRQKFTDSGYYFMYLNNVPNGAHKFDTVNSFQIFMYGDQRNGPSRVNNNENAAFRMLAVVADNLAPTLNFYNGDELITSYTHKYTDYVGQQWSAKAKTVGNLVSADEIFALAQAAAAEGETPLALPTKESTAPEIEYVFDCWTDSLGNPVDAVYMSGDVYASFKEVDNRTKYNVIFKNFDGSDLYKMVVSEGETPVYPAALGTPKKPSSTTNSYEFIGWDPAIAATPTTPEADGAMAADAIVYTAQYKEIELRYDVVYYDEDGTTVLDEDLYIEYGASSTTNVTPVKEADEQYTYTFDKWVTLDGEYVDLSYVTANFEVKPSFKRVLNKYTVTFIDEDGETVLGSSTVDYGTAATAPEVQKESDKVFDYTFETWVDEKGNAVDVSTVKGDIIVFAKYKAEFVPKYDDLKKMKDTDWYAPAVEYVLTNGIMNGMSENVFSLGTNMTRAMVVTVLYRYMGEPDEDLPKKFENFADNEDEGQWYYAAVVWAKANEVVNGKGGNNFDPSGNVTREEFVTILYRFAENIMGEDVGAGKATLTAFADRNEISSWAGSAVKWAYATEEDMNTTGFTPYKKTQYINGKGMKDGKPVMAPKENATRAEVATMLYRYMTGERIPAN